MSVQTPAQSKPATHQMMSFIATLEASGVPERSRDAHRSAVMRLGEFMAPRVAEDVVEADLRSFLAYLGELGVSQQSQGVYRTVLERWLEHLAALASGPFGADDGEETGVLDYSKDPDPVDDEQTWPLRRRGGPAQAFATTAEGAVTGDPGVAAQSSDFGVAFDAAAAAARQAETVVMTAWADDGSPAEAEVLGWDDARVTARAGAPQPAALPQPTPARAVQAPSPSTPAGRFEFVAPVPPAPAALEALAVAPASPFGFGAETGAFGDSTMMLPSGAMGPAPSLQSAGPASSSLAPVGEATMMFTPVAEAPPPAAELPAFLRPPAIPSPRSSGEDSFDPGFSQPAAKEASKGQGKAIALATASGDTSFGSVSDEEPKAARATTARSPRMGEDTLEGWGLRTGHAERKDLSLVEIRNMALAGTITARTMVKRPGGDWMPAGQFAPLRTVFASLGDAMRGDSSARDRASVAAQPLPPGLALILAWMGGLGGAAVAGLGWWLGALVAGQELAPLAALGGLFGGFAATWISRTEGATAAIPGALAGGLSAVLGRYLVYSTLHSGVVTFGRTGDPPSAMRFVQEGMTPTFVISVAMSILLGAALGFVGAGRPR